MTSSFLQSSLFTAVVAFGVAALAFVLGVVQILLGLAVRRQEAEGRVPAGAAGVPAT